MKLSIVTVCYNAEQCIDRTIKSVLNQTCPVYEYIIIDSPPLGMVIDAAIIAKNCDGAIMVVESAKTKYRLAQNVKEKLENAGCTVMGVVLNKVDRKKQGGYYNKYYGASYGKKGYGEYYRYEPEEKE